MTVEKMNQEEADQAINILETSALLGAYRVRVPARTEGERHFPHGGGFLPFSGRIIFCRASVLSCQPRASSCRHRCYV